jgi:antitoxin ParD1/3/4
MSIFDMPNVSLTPELDAFAAACVASGRYANVSEVHRAALRLLQAQEERRQAFTAMLEAAEHEGETQGFLPAEQVLGELDELIAAAATAQ